MSISNAKRHTQRALELIERIKPVRSIPTELTLQEIRFELEAALTEVLATRRGSPDVMPPTSE
jgi:hypothetical protein